VGLPVVRELLSVVTRYMATALPHRLELLFVTTLEDLSSDRKSCMLCRHQPQKHQTELVIFVLPAE